MSTALPIFDVFSGQQPGNIFCLNDQTDIACFMCFKRCVLHPIIQFFNLLYIQGGPKKTGISKNSKNYRSDVIHNITHSNSTPFQFFTLSILHNSNPTPFQSYMLTILHFQSYILPILNLPIFHISNPTLFQSCTLPILHPSNPTLFQS